ncbi:MAG: hypothetical protein E5299_00359 [Burkholderia gladioli]|nr:MAG: hypothetical protein E5299_00359 [Burkholderia gladioli]
MTSDRLRAHVTGLQTVSDERFEPIHRIFGEQLSMLDTAFLPFSMTVTGNCINRTVTPRRTGRIRCSMSGTLARRNRKIGTACRDSRMAWLGVVGIVATDEIYLFVARNLIEQLGQSITVSHHFDASSARHALDPYSH